MNPEGTSRSQSPQLTFLRKHGRSLWEAWSDFELERDRAFAKLPDQRPPSDK